jgi:hypothetical protein
MDLEGKSILLEAGLDNHRGKKANYYIISILNIQISLKSLSFYLFNAFTAII